MKKQQYVLIMLLTMLIGFLSRRYTEGSMGYRFVHDYVGDALWAAMIYFGCRFVFFKKTKSIAVALSVVFCYAIETSQLYHAPWIDGLRQTTLGGLVLGFGFLWSDFVAYAVGIGAVFGLDFFLEKRLK